MMIARGRLLNPTVNTRQQQQQQQRRRRTAEMFERRPVADCARRITIIIPRAVRSIRNPAFVFPSGYFRPGEYLRRTEKSATAAGQRCRGDEVFGASAAEYDVPTALPIAHPEIHSCTYIIRVTSATDRTEFSAFSPTACRLHVPSKPYAPMHQSDTMVLQYECIIRSLIIVADRHTKKKKTIFLFSSFSTTKYVYVRIL